MIRSWCLVASLLVAAPLPAAEPTAQPPFAVNVVGWIVFCLGASEPELFGPLVAVDGMPCVAALFNEKIDAEGIKKQSEAMRDMIGKPDRAGFLNMQKGMTASWVSDPKKAELI